MNVIKNLLKSIRAKLRHILIGHLSYEHQDLEQSLDAIKLALGKHETRCIKNTTFNNIQDAEFKVFSQFGEDGIIQYLMNKVSIQNDIFIELGVGDYRESNTRFLLMNNNWQGKIVNSGTDHIKFLNSELGKNISYRHIIDPVSTFITKENITDLINNFDLPKDFGLLSIDLDGNDYWIWDAITTISPRIVIVEYNSLFGADLAVTVPYKKDFDRLKEHYSGQYFGASLGALCQLSKQKGYQFVGSNTAGVNAFFVRNDVAEKLPKLTAKKGYVKSSHRDSQDMEGNFTYLSDFNQRRKLIADMKLYNVQTKKLETVGKLFNLTK